MCLQTLYRKSILFSSFPLLSSVKRLLLLLRTVCATNERIIITGAGNYEKSMNERRVKTARCIEMYEYDEKERNSVHSCEIATIFREQPRILQ